MAALRQAVLGAWRPSLDGHAREDAGLLELDEPRRERRRRDRAERLRELAEANRPLVRGPDDRDRPAPLGEMRHTADLLGDRLAATAAHVPTLPARGRARAPRRAASRGGSSSLTSHPPGSGRGRPGSV